MRFFSWSLHSIFLQRCMLVSHKSARFSFFGWARPRWPITVHRRDSVTPWPRGYACWHLAPGWETLSWCRERPWYVAVVRILHVASTAFLAVVFAERHGKHGAPIASSCILFIEEYNGELLLASFPCANGCNACRCRSAQYFRQERQCPSRQDTSWALFEHTLDWEITVHFYSEHRALYLFPRGREEHQYSLSQLCTLVVMIWHTFTVDTREL